MGISLPGWAGPLLEREARRVGRFRFTAARRFLRRPIVAGLIVFAILAVVEARTAWLQSRLLALASARMVYSLGAGPSLTFATAPKGPYDRRLGYAELPGIIERLAGSYRVTAQARSSASMLGLTKAGGYPVYPEKPQAGLLITDSNLQPQFESRYPNHVYRTFEDIPPLVVQTLLYIENRQILDDGSPYQNPAVEWNRLAKAAGDLAINKIYPAHPISGGSTLATQLEKVRHSPEGRTASTSEKFRQMMAASLRAYRNGEDTRLTRREIVRDYLNSFPLAAIPGFGEVAGLQEGLRAWLAVDPEEVNRLLAKAPSQEILVQQATAYRQVLNLLLALNRPSYYLRQNPAALAARTDGFLRVLQREGLISHEFSQAALNVDLNFKQRFEGVIESAALGDKGTLALRADLLREFGLPNTYALDRMDLTVGSTFDGEAQRTISKQLRALADPNAAGAAGLNGLNLLGPSNDGSVIYSFTLYEKSPKGNLLRVESDSYDQPLSINRGTRLELGSTAKLRTLVTYLEAVTQLHQEFGGAKQAEREGARFKHRDHITQWALAYLEATPKSGLTAMLEAALDRQYSASPAENFFTGGGLHQFSNFDRNDNGKIVTVREGFRRSVNLVFVRLMRDVEEYYAWRLAKSSPAMLTDPDNSRRSESLARFADAEGSLFLEQFWNKQKGSKPAEAIRAAAVPMNGHFGRLTTLFRVMNPSASVEDLAAFLKEQSGGSLGDDWVRDLYASYSPVHKSWNDLGYLTRMHPLEVWLLKYLREHPEAKLRDAIAASKDVRQETYQWLFQKKNFAAQNTRIQIVLEQEAFAEILKSWKRQGYPFRDIVPSYASALGSSGDNPAALAELAGIILNDGVRKPDLRIKNIRFGEGTPYETLMEPNPPAGERVYPRDLARVVKKAMFDVVENGTGRRAHGSLVLDGEALPIGGKTGTGDNRIEIRGRDNRIIESRARNRTATFVFIIGDRFFGTVTAYVAGDASDNYNFTSALPVQMFRQLAPNLKPMLVSSLKPQDRKIAAR